MCTYVVGGEREKKSSNLQAPELLHRGWGNSGGWPPNLYLEAGSPISPENDDSPTLAPPSLHVIYLPSRPPLTALHLSLFRRERKKSPSEDFSLAKYKYKHTKHPHHDGAVACGRGWARPPSKGFRRINKLKEKIIYFYCLSVNINDNTFARPSPAMIAKTALFIADGGPP